MSWKRNALPLLPWIKLLDQQLASVDADDSCALPVFGGQDVWVFSDYSGQQKNSRYTVIAVLLMDADCSPDWQRTRTEIRRRFLPDGRRMSFKAQNDLHRRLALDPFLDAADLLSGMVAVVAIHKDTLGVCSGPRSVSTYKEVLRLKSRWNEKGFENMLRICHFTALLIAGVTKQRRIIWITDEDEFVANRQRTEDVSRIAAGVLTAYAPHPRRTVEFGTTSIDEDDRGLEDLVALPDLVAGATAEFVTHVWPDGRGNLAGEWPSSPRVSKKTDQIMTWWTQPSRTLKRFLWIVTPDVQAGVQGIRLRRLLSE